MLGTATMAAYAAPAAAPAAPAVTASTAPTPPPPPPPPAPNAAPPMGLQPPPAPPAAPLVGPPGVAATVDGEDIMVNQAKDWAYLSHGPEAVSTLIDFKLLDEEAAKQNIKVTDADLAAKKAEISDRLKPQTLEQALAQRHMTMEFLDANLRHSIEAEKLAGASFKPVEMYHIHHILIRVAAPGVAAAGPDKPHTDAEAKAIIAQVQADLKSGKNFDDLAKQYSEDPTNKDKGGDLGIVHEGTPFDPTFLAAALKLKKGDITPDPVKSSYGYHLIECVSTSDDHPKDEDAAYAKEEDSYRQQVVGQQIPTFMQTLHSKAKIVNYAAQ